MINNQRRINADFRFFSHITGIVLGLIAITISICPGYADEVITAQSPTPSVIQTAPETSFNSDPALRILLSRPTGASNLTITCSGPVEISRVGADSTVESTTQCDSPVNMQVSSAQIAQTADQSDTQTTLVATGGEDSIDLSPGQSVRIDPVNPGDAQSIDPNPIGVGVDSSSIRHYRGSIEITDSVTNTLSVVNTVGVEEYLLGVVGAEIGSGSPVEALKAQAVAARTYALKNRGKLARRNADLDDTTACQTYSGADGENPHVASAVNGTSAQVVSYNGALIDAYYATDCGGETADGGEPYLKSVSDPQCAVLPAWVVSVPIADLLTSLAGINGVTIPNGIDQVNVMKTDLSGRVQTVQLLNSKSGGDCVVTSDQLRNAIGYDKLRSTLFTVAIDKTGEDCVFTGHGWGHGLGMCQVGAIDMAKAGATYDQILGHYYTGTQLAQISDSMLTAAAPIESVRVHVAQITTTSIRYAAPVTTAVVQKPVVPAQIKTQVQAQVSSETSESGEDYSSVIPHDL